jgi:hypothetical protein
MKIILKIYWDSENIEESIEFSHLQKIIKEEISIREGKFPNKIIIETKKLPT